MPIAYCSCGYRNTYSGLKPKTCQSCDASLEPKPLPKSSRSSRAYEESNEIEEEALEGINMEEVRKSVRLQADGSEGLMTMKQLGQQGESLGTRPALGGDLPAEIRGGLQAIRDEVLGKLLGNKTDPSSFTPPVDTRGNARKAGKLTR